MLIDFARHRTAKVCTAAGYRHLKVGTNPLPWTERWISGAEVQVAPQETEISSYIVGGLKNDVTADSFKGLSL
jgi:ribonucleotide reductase beta subunit family protein with ferritin-like domain